MKNTLRYYSKGMVRGIGIIGIVLLVIGVWYASREVVVSHYKVYAKQLPASFEGYRIVQVSDFHNAEFGEGQENLLKRIRKSSPNLIVITGDLISSGDAVKESTLILLEELVEMAPVYYVFGNHEVYEAERLKETFFDSVTALGVRIINDETVTIRSTEGEVITLSGIIDPVNRAKGLRAGYEVEGERLTQSLEAVKQLDEENFNILLAHRPEYIKAYNQLAVDLVLSGHAHGGIVRVPGIGGLYAINQGILPKYTEGSQQVGETELIVSRGLGKSSVPYRIFNPPELVVVTLMKN